MATAQDKAFLAETNKRLGTKYTSIKAYLTDNGELEPKGAKAAGRLAAVENYRGKAKRTAMVLSGAVFEESKKIYGSTANLYNIPELKTIFDDAFVNQWDSDTLIRAIDNTKWATSRTQAQETYDVQKATDPVELQNKVDSIVPTVRRVLAGKGIALDEASIKLIAEKGTRNGWTAEQWDSDSAAEAIRLQPAPTTATSGAAPAPVSAVTASTLRMLAKQFGVDPTDTTLNSWVNEISTNTKTKEQFNESMRSSAQTLYPTLGERLKTETFDSITSPYRTLYSKVLEVDEGSVDLTSPAYSNLFNAGDEKNKRMMNATEWTSFLRKRPEWQNTQNAYEEYASAASTLNKIFGGTR
jgi:hypothetical protein